MQALASLFVLSSALFGASVSFYPTPTGNPAAIQLTYGQNGSSEVYTESAVRGVVVTNTSSSPLTVTSVLTDPDSVFTQIVDPNCASVAPGAYCSVVFIFQPNNDTATHSSSYGTITNSRDGTNQAVALTAVDSYTLPIGFTSLPGKYAGPYNFGNAFQGVTSAQQDIVNLTNPGPNSISLWSVGMLYDNAADFSVANGCPATIAAGVTCQITVSFTPSRVGLEDATLIIWDNLCTTGPQTVAMYGESVLPESPSLQIAGDSWNSAGASTPVEEAPQINPPPQSTFAFSSTSFMGVTTSSNSYQGSQTSPFTPYSNLGNNIPSNYWGIEMWAAVYHGANYTTPYAANSIVNVRNLQVCALYGANGVPTVNWQCSTYAATDLEGEFDTEDWNEPDGTFSPTMLSDGSFTVPMQAYQGSNSTYTGKMDLTHFYPANNQQKQSSFRLSLTDPSDVIAVVSYMEARVIEINQWYPDDRGQSNFVMEVGADAYYCSSPTNTASYCTEPSVVPDIGGGSFKQLSANWRSIAMSTVTPAVLASYPALPFSITSGVLQ